MKKDLLMVFEALHEHDLSAGQIIELLKTSLEIKLSNALEKEEFENATDLNKVLKSLNRLSWSL